MANALYDKGREGFADGSIDWDTNDIKAILVDSADYVLDLANHDNLDDIAGAAIVATSGNLAGKTVTNGVCDANDVTFAAVVGDVCEYVIIYKDSGAAATSRLICCIDTATGIPVTPNGGNITVTWDNGANKIFKL